MRRSMRLWLVCASGFSLNACEGPVEPVKDPAPEPTATAPVSPPATGNPTAQKAPIPFIWSQTDGMQKIPLPAGATRGVATAINSHGDVLGWYYSSSAGHTAFLWSLARGFRELPGSIAGSSNISVADLNDAGQLVGAVSFAWDTGVGFVWKEGGGLTVLSIPGADIAVNGINNNGEVVGSRVYQYESPYGPSVAREGFIWAPTSGFRSVAGATPFDAADARDLNDPGSVVGLDSRQDSRSPRPVLWSASLTSPTGLTERIDYDVCDHWWGFDPETRTGSCGEATAINTHGVAVGSANGRAFRADPGSSTTYLSVAEGRASFATAINDHGDVVGYTVSHPGFASITAAFLWRSDGTVVRLGSIPGTASTYATGINRSGQIVGYAR